MNKNSHPTGTVVHPSKAPVKVGEDVRVMLAADVDSIDAAGKPGLESWIRVRKRYLTARKRHESKRDDEQEWGIY